MTYKILELLVRNLGNASGQLHCQFQIPKHRYAKGVIHKRKRRNALGYRHIR